MGHNGARLYLPKAKDAAPSGNLPAICNREGLNWPPLEDGANISVVASRNGVAANLLYRWRRLMLDGGAVTVSNDGDVASNRAVRQIEKRMRELERQLGRKTLEVEILKEALDKSRSKEPIWLVQSQPKSGSR